MLFDRGFKPENLFLFFYFITLYSSLTYFLHRFNYHCIGPSEYFPDHFQSLIVTF